MWKYDTGLKTNMSLVNTRNRNTDFGLKIIAAILDMQVRGIGKGLNALEIFEGGL